MTIAELALGFSALGVLSGILWKVMSMSKDSGKLTQRVDSIEDRAKEDRSRTERQFTDIEKRTGGNERAITELNNRTATAERSITDLTMKVDLLTSLCYRIEGKLDRVLEKRSETK